jgi:hypothetical protein
MTTALMGFSFVHSSEVRPAEDPSVMHSGLSSTSTKWTTLVSTRLIQAIFQLDHTPHATLVVTIFASVDLCLSRWERSFEKDRRDD